MLLYPNLSCCPVIRLEELKKSMSVRTVAVPADVWKGDLQNTNQPKELRTGKSAYPSKFISFLENSEG